MILHLKNSEIDKHKWDLCIASSQNGLTNVCSWYLDIVCPGWEAIVEDDYVSVMPLPVKRKYGILYSTQPLFIQQLGVFKANSQERLNVIPYLNCIPAKIRSVSMHLNSMNLCSGSGYLIHNRINQQLDLSKEYSALSTAYSRGTKKSIRHSVREGVQIINPISIEEFLKHKNVDPFIKIDKYTLRILSQLIHESDTRKLLRIYGAFDKYQKLCTSILFIVDTKKVYLLISSTNRQGRENNAMFAIMDQIIKDYSNSDLILDFAGSTLEGVRFFNNGFGALESNYWSVSFNTLPWPFSRFKT
jgi:hypothetical protein